MINLHNDLYLTSYYIIITVITYCNENNNWLMIIAWAISNYLPLYTLMFILNIITSFFVSETDTSSAHCFLYNRFYHVYAFSLYSLAVVFIIYK